MMTRRISPEAARACESGVPVRRAKRVDFPHAGSPMRPQVSKVVGAAASWEDVWLRAGQRSLSRRTEIDYRRPARVLQLSPDLALPSGISISKRHLSSLARALSRTFTRTGCPKMTSNGSFS